MKCPAILRSVFQVPAHEKVWREVGDQSFCCRGRSVALRVKTFESPRGTRSKRGQTSTAKRLARKGLDEPESTDPDQTSLSFPPALTSTSTTPRPLPPSQ